MIHIDYSTFRPNAQWKKQSQRKFKKLRRLHINGELNALKNYIDKKPIHWSIIKQDIIDFTVNKCWFTEGMSDVFYFHIEHFRPKKRIDLIRNKYPNYPEARGAANTEGYWWLSFNYKNFRIAGAITNSPKGNYFPLQTGSFVCNSNIENYNNEIPLLLDPTVEGDPDLITFDITGTPYPSANKITNPLEYTRAELSILVYGLKEKLVIDARARVLSECNRRIIRAEKYYSDMTNNPGIIPLQQHFRDSILDLIAMSFKNQPFSSMVKARLYLIPEQWAIDHLHPLI